jgi:hypothetical protein
LPLDNVEEEGVMEKQGSAVKARTAVRDILAAADLSPETASQEDNKIASRISDLPEGPKKERAIRLWVELHKPRDVGEAVNSYIALWYILSNGHEPPEHISASPFRIEPGPQ